MALDDGECLPDVGRNRKGSRKRLRNIAVLVIVILVTMMAYTLGLVALGVPAKAAGLLAGVLVASTIQLVKWIIAAAGWGGGAAPAPACGGGA